MHKTEEPVGQWTASSGRAPCTFLQHAGDLLPEQPVPALQSWIASCSQCQGPEQGLLHTAQEHSPRALPQNMALCIQYQSTAPEYGPLHTAQIMALYVLLQLCLAPEHCPLLPKKGWEV